MCIAIAVPTSLSKIYNALTSEIIVSTVKDHSLGGRKQKENNFYSSNLGFRTKTIPLSKGRGKSF